MIGLASEAAPQGAPPWTTFDGWLTRTPNFANAEAKANAWRVKKNAGRQPGVFP